MFTTVETTMPRVIEGLKVTLPADKLVELCKKQAEYHGIRAQAHAKQIEMLKQNDIADTSNSNSSGRSVIENHESRKLGHESEQAELLFIADHLSPAHYLLDANDLVKLGIRKRAY